MANWDRSFPGENVNWYDEYIQRNAPITVNWLQQPVLREGIESTYIETRGVALYTPDNGQQGRQGLETVLAVSPLDDGSVCLWDVTGTKGLKGAICARSRPGILYIDGPSADNSSRSKRIDSGVTECVSVDSKQHKAFFALQNREFDTSVRCRIAVLNKSEAVSSTDKGSYRSHRGGFAQAHCGRVRIVPMVHHCSVYNRCRRSSDSWDQQW